MADDIVIKLQVNDVVKSTYATETPTVSGIQPSVFLGDDPWYPYDGPEKDVKKSLKTVYKRSGLTKALTILIPLDPDFATEEKFLADAYTNKTTISKAMMFAYPKGHVLNPLENMIINNFRVVQHRLLARIEGVFPKFYQVFSFEAKKIEVL